MKRIFLFSFLLLIILYSGCQGKNVQPDNVIYRSIHKLERGDSITFFRENGTREKILFKNVKDGDIHYKLFSGEGNLVEIAYAKDTLLYDTTEFDNVYHIADTVLLFYDNGIVKASGYHLYSDTAGFQKAENHIRGIWHQYDSLGRLTETIIPETPGNQMSFTYTLYYSGGQPKAWGKQAFVFGSGHFIEGKEWYPNGVLKSTVSNEQLFPANGISYNDCFTVTTETAYYESGSIKSETKTKSFVESDVCPCGTWKFYNEKGQPEKTETHKSCYNFELDCN